MHTTMPDIVTRCTAALAAYGFAVDKLHLGRLGSLVRVALPQGPALGVRLAAAAIAIKAAGLGVDVHVNQAALVAYPLALEA